MSRQHGRWTAIALALAWSALAACSPSSRKAPDASASAGADAGARPAPPRTRPIVTPPPIRPDAGADSGTADCLPAECPTPGNNAWPLRIDGPNGGRIHQVGCCVGFAAGETFPDPKLPRPGPCGVLFNASLGGLGDWCAPIVDGTPDDTCLDTHFDGQVVQGCRHPNGECGHFSAGWGCHFMLRLAWDLEIDDRTTTLPNPFNCVWNREPCQRTNECCSGSHNHPAICWLRYDDADLDADVPIGKCEIADDLGEPLPDYGEELERF